MNINTEEDMEIPAQVNNQNLGLVQASSPSLEELFGPLPDTIPVKDRDPDKLFEGITREDVVAAAYSAFKGHNSKSDVKAFKAHFDERIDRIYNAIKDGSYRELIKYRKLKKTNHKGKERLIDSPNLDTRILQHLWLYLIVPFYDKKDNGNGKNCKPGFGITAKTPRNSTLHCQKHLYYDLREFHYVLLIDQRKCYEHITPKIYRKQIKNFTRDSKFIDFGEDIGFINKKLPIGTPTSPYIHHLCLWASDTFIRNNTEWSQRYADDNAIAFRTIEDLHAFKWRIMNFWWYELRIRAKRHMTRILNIDKMPMDYCGFLTYRIPNKKVSDHNKGYCRVRRTSAKRAIDKCRNLNIPKEKVQRSYASYFGQFIHADEFKTLNQIEATNMKLDKLTESIRIDREIDAPQIDIRDLLGVKFNLYKYRLKEYKGQINWIQCLIGTSEKLPTKKERRSKDIKNILPRQTSKVKKTKDGKLYAYEFHGNYQGLISYILALRDSKPNKDNWFMPIEDAEIVKESEYLFKGSTNKVKFIKHEDYVECN